MPKKKIESTGSLFDWAAEPGPTSQAVTTKFAVIYTDGACSPNPGFGGWAAVILADEQKRSVVGGADGTTNNRMELQAAIEGLRTLAEPTQVQLVTDSQYVRNGITQWLPNWVRRGWQTKDKTPVKWLLKQERVQFGWALADHPAAGLNRYGTPVAIPARPGCCQDWRA